MQMLHHVAWHKTSHTGVPSTGQCKICRRLALVPTKVRVLLPEALHASTLSVVSPIWAVAASMKYTSASGVRVEGSTMSCIAYSDPCACR